MSYNFSSADKHAKLCIGSETYSLKPLRETSRTPFISIFDPANPKHAGADDEALRSRIITLNMYSAIACIGQDVVRDMAKAGFIYTGEGDTIVCVECKKDFAFWTSHDPAFSERKSPVEEHKEQSPHCSMAVSSNDASAAETSKTSKKKGRGKQAADIVEIPQPSPNQGSAFHLRPPPKNGCASEASGYTDMTILDNRKRSFLGKWPKENIIPGDKMADAGFWYKGPHDRVECFNCRGRLVNFFKGDNPVGEHARHFPSCSFIQNLNNAPLCPLNLRCAKACMQIGYEKYTVLKAYNTCVMEGVKKPNTSQILDAIFTLEQEQEKERMSMEDTTKSSLAKKTPVAKKSSLEVAKEKNTELIREQTCCVCYDEKRNCVFLPCRHLVACEECASKVDYCPVCRLQIIGTVKTYQS